MLEEFQRDAAAGSIYLSNYLNEGGCERWPDLLREALAGGNDDSLANSLRLAGCFRTHAQRRKPKGGFTMVAVPVTALIP
jgi:hypothetical protein